jgi:hypothetical protein
VAVDDEVETIAAGLRGKRAFHSGERDAIRLEARNWLITGLIGGLIPRAGFTRRSRRGFVCAVRPTRASRRHLGQAAFSGCPTGARVRRKPNAFAALETVSSVGFPPTTSVLHMVSWLRPVSLANALAPQARAMSPRTSAITLGSPSSNAARRYSA